MHRPQFIVAMAICLLILGRICAPAFAQEPTDRLDACTQLTDAAARLACFDDAMQQRHGAAAASIAAPALPAASAVPAPASGTQRVTTARKRPLDDTIGLDGKQLSIKRKEEGIEPEVVEPMVATLARLQLRPGHLYYFELANGQVWESIEGESDLFLSPHDTVTIRPGVLGAFFLKTQQGISIRVHRLR